MNCCGTCQLLVRNCLSCCHTLLLRHPVLVQKIELRYNNWESNQDLKVNECDLERFWTWNEYSRLWCHGTATLEFSESKKTLMLGLGSNLTLTLHHFCFPVTDEAIKDGICVWQKQELPQIELNWIFFPNFEIEGYSTHEIILLASSQSCNRNWWEIFIPCLMVHYKIKCGIVDMKKIVIQLIKDYQVSECHRRYSQAWTNEGLLLLTPGSYSCEVPAKGSSLLLICCHPSLLFSGN